MSQAHSNPEIAEMGAKINEIDVAARAYVHICTARYAPCILRTNRQPFHLLYEHDKYQHKCCTAGDARLPHLHEASALYVEYLDRDVCLAADELERPPIVLLETHLTYVVVQHLFPQWRAAIRVAHAAVLHPTEALQRLVQAARDRLHGVGDVARERVLAEVDRVANRRVAARRRVVALASLVQVAVHRQLVPVVEPRVGGGVGARPQRPQVLEEAGRRPDARVDHQGALGDAEGETLERAAGAVPVDAAHEREARRVLPERLHEAVVGGRVRHYDHDAGGRGALDVGDGRRVGGAGGHAQSVLGGDAHAPAAGDIAQQRRHVSAALVVRVHQLHVAPPQPLQRQHQRCHVPPVVGHRPQHAGGRRAAIQPPPQPHHRRVVPRQRRRAGRLQPGAARLHVGADRRRVHPAAVGRRQPYRAGRHVRLDVARQRVAAAVVEHERAERHPVVQQPPPGHVLHRQLESLHQLRTAVDAARQRAAAERPVARRADGHERRKQQRAAPVAEAQARRRVGVRRDAPVAVRGAARRDGPVEEARGAEHVVEDDQPAVDRRVACPVHADLRRTTRLVCTRTQGEAGTSW